MMRLGFFLTGKGLRSRKLMLLAVAGFVLAAATGQAHAEDALIVEGGLTAIYQAASDDRARPEASASGDLEISQTFGSWILGTHLEGSTTPRVNGVNALVPGANNDSGSALNSRDHGRLQVSELYAGYEIEAFSATFGLLDAKGFLDGSHVANDEAGQFLNHSLVNNPSIEFPDYMLAGVVSLAGEGWRPSVTLLGGGSNGLADNPSHSYTELAQLGASGKGVFAAAELGWDVAALGKEGAVRTGVWTNTADHTRLDATASGKANAGLYGVVDGTVASFAWNMRAGVADKTVSPVAWFVGAAVEHPVAEKLTAGLGLTHMAASDDLGAGFGDSTQAEAYLRYDVIDHLHLTPGIQYVTNPGFDDTGSLVDDHVWVFGLRLGYDL